MQQDIKYEPDLVLSMVAPGSAKAAPKARVIKSRYKILTVGETYEFTAGLCEQLRKYLDEGANPEELLEEQRKEYVKDIKEYLDNHPNAVPIWNMLKKDAGFETAKLSEMPLDILKKLFIKLTLE